MTIIAPIGTEILVNTSVAHDQIAPSVAALDGGRYVVVWVDVAQSPNPLDPSGWTGSEIRGQIFNADGSKSGSEFLVNSTTSGLQLYAQAVTLDDGHFIVSWQDGLTTLIAPPGSPPAGIRAQEYSGMGLPVGGEFTLGTPAVQSHPAAIAALPGGGYMGFWQEGPGGNLVGQLYDSANVAVGSRLIIDSTHNDAFHIPVATTLANGNIIVGWREGAGATNGLALQLVSSAGTLIGGPVYRQIANGGAFSTSPTDIVALTGGGFALSFTQSSSLDGLRAQIVEVFDAGAAYQWGRSVALDFNFGFGTTRLAPLDNGGVAIVWSEENFSTGPDVFLSAYTATGNIIGQTALFAQSSLPETQLFPAAVALDNGRIAVVWADENGQTGDGDGYGINARLFQVDPANQAPIAMDDSFIAPNTVASFSAASLTSNDEDFDGDDLTITAITNVQGGAVTLNSVAQTFQVTRSNGSTAPVTFDYVVSDAAGITDTGHASLLLTRDDTVILRGPRNTLDFLANDALPERPDRYEISFTPESGDHIISYALIGNGPGVTLLSGEFGALYPGGTGSSLSLSQSVDYALSGNGYAFLPVGQTLSQSFTYTVSNPWTGLADYAATISITLEGWAQTGGTGYDELSGGALSDHLIGGTGAANALIGRAGDDWYTVQAIGDSVIEAANEGLDRVWTPLSVFVLPDNVEELIFTGPANTPVVGVGNASDNLMSGRNGRDELFGGAGDDRLVGGPTGTTNDNSLFGGTGDDTFVVRSRGDSTIEALGEGTDTVETTFSIYGLQANIENLTLTDSGPHEAGVGNGLDNVITGNRGVDSLFGRDGNDTLRGGTGVANTLLGQEGDDLYIAAAIGDSVIEFANEGHDTILTALPSFVLRDHVEDLIFSGAGTFIGIGSSGANAITGGGVADFLSGLDGDDMLTGGNGADELLGGAGNDHFLYEGTETGLDRIYDFTSGSDKIALSSALFNISPTVDFAQGSGAMATSANSSFIHDIATGIISYDDDGTGPGTAIALAQVNAGLTLAAGDFIFF